MTKQEKIKEAYGEFWEAVKDFVDENGWLRYGNYKLPSDIEMETDAHHNEYYDRKRPSSLTGIENNRGWVKIENESDLPKEVINCFVKTKTQIVNTTVLFDAYRNEFTDGKINQSWKHFTHYRPIEKPLPPIY